MPVVFAENAWFVSQREDKYKDVEIRDIAKEAFRLADGCTIKFKKRMGLEISVGFSPLMMILLQKQLEIY